MIDFIEEYALPEDQKKEERVIESKSQTSINNVMNNINTGYKIITSVSEIQDKILPEWNAALLYVTQKDKDDYRSVVTDLADAYGLFINVCILAVDDTQVVNAELKREFKTNKLPLIRFYPINKTGDEKKKDSFEIILPEKATIDKVKEIIVSEI